MPLLLRPLLGSSYMNQSPSGPFLHLHTVIVCSDYMTLAHTIKHKQYKPLAICHHVKTKVDKWMKLLVKGKHDKQTGDAGKKGCLFLCLWVCQTGCIHPQSVTNDKWLHSLRWYLGFLVKQSSHPWLRINFYSNSLSGAKSLAYFGK